MNALYYKYMYGYGMYIKWESCMQLMVSVFNVIYYLIILYFSVYTSIENTGHEIINYNF